MEKLEICNIYIVIGSILEKFELKENVSSLAPHDIAIFQYLTNSVPEKINFWQYFQKGIPDSTITELEYPNGVKGHIFVG